MKKRFFWIGVLCVSLLAVSFSLILKMCSGKDEEKQEDKNPVRSISTVLEEIKRMPLPESKPSYLICPFTDAENRITTETVAIYLPALYKISFSPDCLVKTPFPPNIQISAKLRGFFQPGKMISEDELLEFVRIFGCRDYITGVIQKKDSTVEARITIHNLDGNSKEKIIIVSDSSANLLPNRIATRVLTELTGSKLPEANNNYLEIPSAKNPEILKKAAEEFILYCYRYDHLKPNKFMEILDQDPEMDWFVSICLTILPKNQEILDLSEKYDQKWKDRPGITLLHSSILCWFEKSGPTIMQMPEIIRLIPDNPKVFEVLARSVQKNGKIFDAAPFYQRMLDLAPDDAWCNGIMGVYKIDLAWEHRGSGWASTVTEEGWKNFYNCLGEAKEYLMKCIALDSKNYQAYGYMITVGMGLSSPISEIREFFDKAVDINPDYRDAYSRMQAALMPKWCGSMPQLYSFWGEILNKDARNHYVYTVVADGCSEIAKDNSNSFFEQKEKYYRELKMNLAAPHIWPWIQRSYEKFFSDGFEDTQQRAVYGFYAAMADKYDLSFEQFERSRMDFHETLFFRYDELLWQYTRAAMQTGHYDRGVEIARKGIQYNAAPEMTKSFQEFIDYAEKKKKMLNQ